jgi:FkbM family methyltransferase
VITKFIRKLNRMARPNHWLNFANFSFSQNGEDTMLINLFSKNKGGFFVDVGAHHPYRFSNTYLLYRRGWSGINIDALPGTKQLFDKHRPRDVTIEMGVSEVSSNLTYWSFKEPAYNTFDEELGHERAEAGISNLLGRITIPTRPLSEILAKRVRVGQTIDLLTVDVEGFDAQVLRSNDWNRFRPSVVLCEVLGTSFEEMATDEVYVYMSSVGYTLHSKLNSTAVFTQVEPK